MPASPTTRRRRILNAVTSTIAKPSNYYSAVPSARRSRRNTSSESSFLSPINDPSDQYQIQVAKDGSMITAVPIANHTSNNNSLWSSPILYSDAHALDDPPLLKSTVKQQTWSRQGLLEARGKQRSKLKNRSDDTKEQSGLSNRVTPFQPVSTKGTAQVHRTDDVSEQLHWDLSKVNEEQEPTFSDNQFKIQTQPSKKPDKRNDDRYSNFPILSPTRKFDEDGQSNRDASGPTSAEPVSIQNEHETKPKSTVSSIDETKRNRASVNNPNVKQPLKPSPKVANAGIHSFQNLLEQRMQEIQSEQSRLVQSITEKEMIERTLISAIDENLVKNRKRMNELDKELEEIRWHLTLSPNEGQQDRTNSPTESVGDPSLTMIDSTNGSLMSARDMKQKSVEKVVTGIDPPASSSPENINIVTKARSGARLRGEEPQDMFHGTNRIQEQKRVISNHMSVMPIRRVPGHLDKPPQQQQQHVISQTLQTSPFSSRRGRSSFLNAARRKGIKKNVRFKLHENEAEKLKIVDDSHFVDDFNTNGHFDEQINFRNNEYPLSSHQMAPAMNEEEIWLPIEANKVDNQSWQGSQHDIERFDETTTNDISSGHHDTFQWRDQNHPIVTTEHYFTDNHHNNVFGNEPRTLAFMQYSRNKGASSDSVETDPDLGFVHAVAAVVIQTAVRRFLAEIRAMERLDAVQVIQTAICRWMARQTDPNLHAYRVVRKGVTRMPSPIHNSPTTRKRMMFQYEQNAFYHNEATIIQRCYRGWWAREGIQIDHYAASQIQRVFRGWWMREALEVDRYCAVEIQRVVRGYLGRMSYMYDLYCVIVTQSIARRYLAFYESAFRLANILYIQAIWRGYRVRSELIRYVQQGQEAAAIIIQAQYRSYDAQMNFINTLADILIVQSVARRWLTLRRQKKTKLSNNVHHTVRRQQQTAHISQNRSSVSRAIENLQHYHMAKQHPVKPNVTSPRLQSSDSPRHNLPQNPSSRPQETKFRSEYPLQNQEHNPDSFGAFQRNGAEEWYDGNKFETSEMLTNWKRRR